jgi:hypothetical protein
MRITKSDHRAASFRIDLLSSRPPAHIFGLCLPVLHHATFIRTGKLETAGFISDAPRRQLLTQTFG